MDSTNTLSPTTNAPRVWAALLSLLFVLPVACSFDASGLAEKTDCRGSADCPPSLICSCDQCVPPSEKRDLCTSDPVQDAGSTGGGTGGDDVTLEDTQDEDISVDTRLDTEDSSPPEDAVEDTTEDTPEDPSLDVEDIEEDVSDEDSSPDVEEDTTTDTGCTENVCGGCESLPEVPGDSCGSCGGVWICNGANSVTCSDDRQLNACGGCAVLEELVGSECGTCPGGTIVCDGTDATLCEGGLTNACGSCQELPAEPGDSCGICGDGVWQCGDQRELFCAGSGLNVCGGCDPLEGSIGDVCGTCDTGVLSCSSDGESLDCSVGDDANACGGCVSLPEDRPLGGSCGECNTGSWVCDGTDGVRCEGGEQNACGGCAVLNQAPGDECGCPEASELWVCEGQDALRCDDNRGLPASPIDLGRMRQNSDDKNVTEQLHDAADEDWFALEIRDDVGGGLNPRFVVESVTDVTVCAYMRRVQFNLNGPDPTCQRGSFSNTYGDLPGCCSEQTQGPGEEEIRFGNVDSGIELDHMEVLIHVYARSEEGSCEPYALQIDP